MCEITTTGALVASIVMAAMSTATSYVASSKNAKAQNAYQRQVAEAQNDYMVQNAKLANDAFVNKSAQENIRLGQVQDQTASEIQKDQVEATKAAGYAVASSEGAGNAVIADIFRTQGQNKDVLETNLKWEQDQAKMNMTGYRSEALGRIADARPYIPQYTNGPSAGAALTSFGQSALNSYTSIARREDPKTKKVYYKL